jgi:hypothetical protein
MNRQNNAEKLANRKKIAGALGLTVLAGCLLTVSATPALGQLDSSDKLIRGDSAVVAGSVVSTWARVNQAGQVTWVGLTMPLALVDNMPADGSGPAGAIAVLSYPPLVTATTYFNHVEIHSEPEGHPTNPAFANANRYGVPHFDFDFFSIPVSQVLTIPFGFFPDQAPADRLPRFYAQPEALSVPQIGRHAPLLSEFTATDHWLATMIAGFPPDASFMDFVEPMITRELLMQRRSFTMQMPKPATLGRATRYPAEFLVLYDHATDAYNLVFTGFASIQ